jgi:prephenate dehydrogenase
MKDRKFGKVAIVGLGLIGGSLAWSLKKSGRVENVTGIDVDRDSIDFAISKKIIDEGHTDLRMGVSRAEIVVIATHVGEIIKTAREIIPCAAKGSVITDVGSVKGRIVRDIEKLLPARVHFVGGHPIAGTENSGVRAGDPDLFRGRRFIITPTSKTDPKAIKKVASLWETAGSDVYEMDAQAHDRIFGFVSHLPHIVAYSLVDTVLSAPDSETLLDFAGGGLGDFTRVAASSPEMWSDIFTANRVNALKAVRKFRKSLQKLETAIESGDSEPLKKLLSRSSLARRKDFK